jgi:DNA polymerase-3 subunit gamma/tau
VQKGGLQADDDALHIVGQKADGALHALSIFDRITAGAAGGRIAYERAENLNVLDYDYYFSATGRAVLAEDASAMLNLFDRILRKGFEPDIFINGLAEHLRNILVCKDAASAEPAGGRRSAEGPIPQRHGSHRSGTVHPDRTQSLLMSVILQFKTARNKPLHVEMALLRKCATCDRMVKTRRTGRKNS